MLDEITRSVIRESTTRQLHTAFDRPVEATSFRSAQGLGTDQSLTEMVTEIVAEMNAHGNRR